MFQLLLFATLLSSLLLILYWQVYSSKTKLQWLVLTLSLTTVLYYFTGNPRLLWEYYQSPQISNRLRNKQLQPLNSKLQKELVSNLVLIDENRSNTLAWFNIAKIYELQGQYALAQDAYYNLMNFEPQNDFFFKQFVKMSSKNTKGVLSSEIRQKIINLLQKQEDITFLNLLAIDSYNTNEFMRAANYWLRVYELAKATDTNNEMLADIQGLIEACKQKLKG